MKILIKISGSISAFKICSVVSELTKTGHDVKVAATENSLKFIGASTWESLSQNIVFSDDFSPGQRLNHISLNDWADVVVLAPATAQTLNALVSGVGVSVVTTVFLARKKETPYLIFPAMNPRMWMSESVQKSVETLNKFKNVTVFNPENGLMACGHKGTGRLSEPSFVLNEILKHDKKNKKALVTFGGTVEDIDGVRKITNFSSGQTGTQIAEYLKKAFKVTVLASKNSLQVSEGLEGVEVISYTSFSELSKKLQSSLEKNDFDIVVHAAAVSDFIPVKVQNKKISSFENLKISFTKTPKLLNSIRKWSKNKNCKIISFKLTHNQSKEEILEKIKQQFENSETDFIIQNELSGINFDKHEYLIWRRDVPSPEYLGDTKMSMVKDIMIIGEL